MKFEEWMLLWNLLDSVNQRQILDPGYVLHPAVTLDLLGEIAVVWFTTMVDPSKGALNVFLDGLRNRIDRRSGEGA